jgi:uncharacterized membrane protein
MPSDVQPQEESDKIVAALCYIFAPILGVIILITDMKNKPFLKFHAYQSITFGIALIVLWTIASFLAVVLIGCFIMPLLLVAQLWYAYQAYSKGTFKIPGVTDITYNLFKDTPRI